MITEVTLCPKCRRPLRTGNTYRYGKEIICEECLDKASAAPQNCPNCGGTIDAQAEGVGLLLTPVGSTPEQKTRATEVLVIVCPHCHILFFDQYHYKVLEGLKV